jgi:hypothetical protein
MLSFWCLILLDRPGALIVTGKAVWLGRIVTTPDPEVIDCCAHGHMDNNLVKPPERP